MPMRPRRSPSWTATSARRSPANFNARVSGAAAGTNPDLLLQYETAAAEKTKSNPFRIGIGMGGAGSNGAAGVGVSSASERM